MAMPMATGGADVGRIRSGPQTETSVLLTKAMTMTSTPAANHRYCRRSMPSLRRYLCPTKTIPTTSSAGKPIEATPSVTSVTPASASTPKGLGASDLLCRCGGEQCGQCGQAGEDHEGADQDPLPLLVVLGWGTGR